MGAFRLVNGMGIRWVLLNSLCLTLCLGSSLSTIHPRTVEGEGIETGSRGFKALKPYSLQYYRELDERRKREANSTLLRAVESSEEEKAKDLYALVPADCVTDYEINQGCRCVPFYNCCNETAVAGFCGDAIDLKTNLDYNEKHCSVDYFQCCSLSTLCGDDIECLVKLSLVPAEAEKKPAKVIPVPPTVREPPPIQGPVKCGVRNFEGVGVRLAGSADVKRTQFGEFPWMVALLRVETLGRAQPVDIYVCGAVLISANLVATVAHCVADFAKSDFSNLRARTGEWDTLSDSEPYIQHDHKIKKIIVHPEYVPKVVLNDIAILVLEEPARISSFVSPICLPKETENEQYTKQKACVVTGWGKNSFFGKYQNILKLIEISMVPKEDCETKMRLTRLGPRFKLHPSFNCAGGNGYDACKGDGGSPLVCPSPYFGREPENIRYVLTGLVAWGISCGGVSPGIYANIPFLMPFIEPYLKEYDPGYDYLGRS